MRGQAITKFMEAGHLRQMDCQFLSGGLQFRLGPFAGSGQEAEDHRDPGKHPTENEVFGRQERDGVQRREEEIIQGEGGAERSYQTRRQPAHPSAADNSEMEEDGWGCGCHSEQDEHVHRREERSQGRREEAKRS